MSFASLSVGASTIASNGLFSVGATAASAAGTAPLLCAGITTYSPLRHWQVGPGSKVETNATGTYSAIAAQFMRPLSAMPFAPRHPGPTHPCRGGRQNRFCLFG